MPKPDHDPLLRSATPRDPASRLLKKLPALLILAALALLLSGCNIDADKFAKAMDESPLVGTFIAFGAGLGTCLTPCVYPMIAVTVSIFGAREATSRRQAMLLSTSFVLGIVVLFTTMLVIAALTGGVMGSVLSNKWVLIGISLVFVALSLSMFGAFEMVLPDSIMQRLSAVGGIGYGGAFLLGLVSGVIAAPCTGPVLTGILLWIGKTQNIALGAIVGTTFSIGLGIPFWLVGTFAVALPKGGKWMLWVKSFFGIVILTYAFHLQSSVMPSLTWLARPDTKFFLIMLGVVAAGLALGAVHVSWDDGGFVTKARKGVGIAATVVGGFLAWASFDMPKVSEAPIATAAHDGEAQAASKRLLTWGHSEKDAVKQAKDEKRPLLVDFTAEWCGACKKMAKETFADPRVMEKAGHFVAVKVDATDDEDKQIEAVKGKYGVVGLPTVVVYDSTGAERKRFNDFVGPEDFLKAIDGIN